VLFAFESLYIDEFRLLWEWLPVDPLVEPELSREQDSYYNHNSHNG